MAVTLLYQQFLFAFSQLSLAPVGGYCSDCYSKALHCIYLPLFRIPFNVALYSKISKYRKLFVLFYQELSNHFGKLVFSFDLVKLCEKCFYIHHTITVWSVNQKIFVVFGSKFLNIGNV